MSDRYWDGHNDGGADMRERCDKWRERDRKEISELRALIRKIRYLPIDRDTDTLEGYADAVRAITRRDVLIGREDLLRKVSIPEKDNEL